MQTIAIICLVASFITTVFVVSALMLSSRASQEEGVTETYDDWEAPEATGEVYPPQLEQ